MPSHTPIRGGYVDVERLEDAAAGLRAVISRRNNHFRHTAAFFKVFERDGAEEHTSFFEKKHLRPLAKLMERVAQRIQELEDSFQSSSPDVRPGSRGL